MILKPPFHILLTGFANNHGLNLPHIFYDPPLMRGYRILWFPHIHHRRNFMIPPWGKTIVKIQFFKLSLKIHLQCPSIFFWVLSSVSLDCPSHIISPEHSGYNFIFILLIILISWKIISLYLYHIHLFQKSANWYFPNISDMHI